MNTLNNRLKIYRHISTNLASLSDQELSAHLYKATSMHSGIGGKSVLLILDEIPIFVKKVPLTDLERQPENIMATANLFNLPLYYQYGVGSSGFGVWRELAAHIMTTNWVITQECPNFPLLYHWRVLPTAAPNPNPMDAEQFENLKSNVEYWENNQAVQARLEAIHHASADVLLFLEYIPQTLHQWLGDQLGIEDNKAEWAVSFVEENLNITNQFMINHNFLHFDAHFENILTDGDFIYFSDFGLSLSLKFDLTDEEKAFFEYHRRYDQCSITVNFLYSLIKNLFKKDQWVVSLRDYLDGKHKEFPSFLFPIIKQYAPIAFIMDEFYQKLRKETKLTVFPADKLKCLLADNDLKI